MLFKNLTHHFVREEPATDQQQKDENHTILSRQLLWEPTFVGNGKGGLLCDT